MRMLLALVIAMSSAAAQAEPPKPKAPPASMTREEASDLRAAMATLGAADAQCEVIRGGVVGELQRLAELVRKYDLHLDQAKSRIVEAIDLDRHSPTYGAISRPARPPAPALPHPPVPPHAPPQAAPPPPKAAATPPLAVKPSRPGPTADKVSP